MLCLPNLEEEKVEQGECVDLMRPDRLCLALVFKVPISPSLRSLTRSLFKHVYTKVGAPQVHRKCNNPCAQRKVERQ